MLTRFLHSRDSLIGAVSLRARQQAGFTLLTLSCLSDLRRRMCRLARDRLDLADPILSQTSNIQLVTIAKYLKKDFGIE